MRPVGMPGTHRGGLSRGARATAGRPIRQRQQQHVPGCWLTVPSVLDLPDRRRWPRDPWDSADPVRHRQHVVPTPVHRKLLATLCPIYDHQIRLLPPGASAGQIAEAVAWAAPVFEMVECHFHEWAIRPADAVAAVVCVGSWASFRRSHKNGSRLRPMSPWSSSSCSTSQRTTHMA